MRSPRLRLRLRRLLLLLSSSSLFGYRGRYVLLRLAGIRIGHSRISPRCFFSGRVTIGDSCFVNRECMFDGFAPITIGDRCAFGMRVTVVTATHDLGPSERRAATAKKEPVTIGDGCWIGAGAIILPGVDIAPGCVIAAGSVVVADCEPDGLYAGAPAVRKRDLDPREAISTCALRVGVGQAPPV